MIPFNSPTMVGHELEYVREVLGSAKWCGDGPFTHRCEKWLEQHFGAKRVLLTTSCTDALEMSALLTDIQPGDEVIVPSFTFVSSINAFVLRGARPIFVDVRADTVNIDEKLIEKKITPRTKAIVVVHYAGVACAMDEVSRIAHRHGITVIEDNAHGLFASYRGARLGTLARMSTLSFHETKNISCGEGGALILNDERDIERAEVLREKGTNRRRFMRGQVDKYTWVDVGSSFLPSDVNAAILLAQLEKHDSIQTRRHEIWREYADGIAKWCAHHDVKQPTIPAGCEHSAHMYYLIAPSLDFRSRFMAHLKNHGVATAFHYQSLHLSDMGRRYGGREGDCPVTEKMSDSLVRLPMWNGLTREQVANVIAAVNSF